MSIFKKIKQGLGIGTVKLELEVPDSLPRDAGEINGKVILSAKSDQKVLSMEVRLGENTIEKSGDDEIENFEEIASITLAHSFEMKQDEIKEVEFSLPFELPSLDGSGENILDEIVSLFSPLSRGFEVQATADLDGVVLDPSDFQHISFSE